MPSDETRYYERATNYRELAEQATRPELRPVYLHLAAGYDRLAQFHEDVRVLLAPVGAPLGGDGIATFDAVVPRQFPPPWSIERTATGWRVADATGRALVSSMAMTIVARGPVSR